MVPHRARGTPPAGSACPEQPACSWGLRRVGLRVRGAPHRGQYSRAVCREAHPQEGVQEQGGAVALEFALDLGVDLHLARRHLFLPADWSEQIKPEEAGEAEAANKNLKAFFDLSDKS